MRLRRIALLSLFLFGAAWADDPYLAARKAQQNGDDKAYLKLRQQLDKHPLASYLDYYFLKDHIQKVQAKEVRDFENRYPDSPLGAFLVQRFIDEAARRKDWQSLLAVTAKAPSDEERRCFYFLAKLESGAQEEAWQGAEQLYLVGHSLPKGCDPLFNAWQKTGHLTQELVLSRMELAFASGQGGLLGYLARQLHAGHAEAGKEILALFSDPARVAHQRPLGVDPERSRRLMVLAVERAARRDPVKGWRLWMQARDHVAFTAPQRQQLARFLTARLYDTDNPKAVAWRDEAVRYYRDDEMTERRIRYALSQGALMDARDWIGVLSQEEQADERWQYWLARTEPDAAKKAELLKVAAQNRSYYGFLAAEDLGLPFQLNETQVPPMTPGLADMGALKRIPLLLDMGENQLARMEWYHLLTPLSGPQRQALAGWAHEQGFENLAILAAIRGDGWDLVSLRFPVAFADEFERFGKEVALPQSLLLALSRQESALDPKARSPVGARGLMQLMPKTARLTARHLGDKQAGDLFDPEVNIRLGSQYLKEMLERFDNNRILAAAAYNAGPERVDRWVGKDLPFDAFVESIPFRETRNYVQNVLAFNVIYQQKLGKDKPRMLTQGERKYRY
ncbi:transglycosylase SLT domain-containing protein [Gallaecimonas kandeliae]|uniref:transglycosylase SLT domain-containing protein n=1 Tax=Gallaecimonas kandeliae TaxID=3029055 RepID=UPI00264998A7|nr:transglycosylase SLT domain-containing protein [Gallaecimonas kandeliae]WKE66683.1 transglycosylase SLT domain-containing protein [Gallaecimonas kandeliae]